MTNAAFAPTGENRLVGDRTERLTPVGEQTRNLTAYMLRQDVRPRRYVGKHRPGRDPQTGRDLPSTAQRAALGMLAIIPMAGALLGSIMVGAW